MDNIYFDHKAVIDEKKASFTRCADKPFRNWLRKNIKLVK